MYFLTKQDFDTVISSSELGKLLAGPQKQVPQADQDRVLSQAVATAVDEVVSHVSGRYDLELAFAATGDDRNTLLVTRMVDLALYHLYSIIAPQNIPDLRRDRYAEAVDLFKAAGKGTRFLQLPIKAIEEKTTFLLYGSNPQYRYY